MGYKDQDLEIVISREFGLLGFMARSSDIARLADALRTQGAEYDEVSIMAACTGYCAAKGFTFA